MQPPGVTDDLADVMLDAEPGGQPEASARVDHLKVRSEVTD